MTKFLGFYVLGNVTLDLAGNTLDVTENNLTFYYGYKDENNYNFRSNLTIKDSGNGNNGKIIGEGHNGRVRLSTNDMAEELKIYLRLMDLQLMVELMPLLEQVHGMNIYLMYSLIQNLRSKTLL